MVGNKTEKLENLKRLLRAETKARMKAEEQLRDCQERLQWAMTAEMTGHDQYLERGEHLKALMDHNPSLFFLKDESGRYIYLNKTYEKHFIHSSDWYGKTDFDFWPKESAELFRENDALVLKSNQVRQFLEESNDMGGNRYCWLCYKFSFNGSDNRRFLGGIGINATERVLAEEALQTELIRTAILRDIAATAAHNIDPGDLAHHVLTLCHDLLGIKTGYVYMADQHAGVLRALALQGVTEDFRYDIDTIPFVERESILTVCYFEGKTLTHDSDFGLIKTIRDQNTWGQDSGWIVLPICLSGKVAGVMGFSFAGRTTFSPQVIEFYHALADQLGVGIERMWAVEALEKSEEKYRTLFEAMDEGFALCEPVRNTEGRILDIRIVELNSAFERLSGHTSSESAGCSLSKLFPGMKDWYIQTYGRILETGRSTRVEGYIPQNDHWYDMDIIPRGQDRFAILYNDITARKRTERSLREYAEALQKADQNKNEFLGTLSHELRNPLASIMMGISLLKRIKPGSEEARKTQDILERQTYHLSRLVDDLLEVTRISRNKIELKKEVIDLDHLARKIVEDYQPMFAEKGVTLDAQIEAQPVLLNADPTRMTQVLGNLLHNALKFTEKGGQAQMTVLRDASAREVIIRIQDTGMGIRQERLSDLFEPFVQAERTLDRGRGGLGLGLAIAKGIVELHQGTIQAESPGLGKGSVFTIRLPQNIGKETEPKSPKQTEDSQKENALKILVIDDIPDVAEILCSLLSLLGHKVLIAHSGPEGLVRALEHKPDVIFCDIGLPGMSGYEVAKVIRSNQTVRETYLIALSGYAQNEDLKLSTIAGFDRHLAKPVDLETLDRVLSEIALEFEPCK